MLTTPDGNEYSALSGLPKDQSDVKATTQAHVGAEYLIIRPKYTVPLRAGFFYDPGPAEKSPIIITDSASAPGLGLAVLSLIWPTFIGSEMT